MPVDHSLTVGVSIAVGLANTNPTGAPEREEINDVEDLRLFVTDHGFREIALTPADLGPVRSVRDALRDIFASRDVAFAADVLNGLVAGVAARPRMRRHDGFDWHVDWHVNDAAPPEHVLMVTTVPLMDYLSREGFDRIGTCSRPDCERFFIDTTRNHSKRFCDGRNCGGRMHARAFRARRAGARTESARRR